MLAQPPIRRFKYPAERLQNPTLSVKTLAKSAFFSAHRSAFSWPSANPRLSRTSGFENEHLDEPLT